MTRIVGEMDRWSYMNQHDPAQGIDVRPVNIDQISEERKKELREQKIVILACPTCKKKYQWLREALPKN